jgi:hypothetical protein
MAKCELGLSEYTISQHCPSSEFSGVHDSTLYNMTHPNL